MALSLGLSIAVVSLVVALLYVSAWGLQLNPLILFIVILTVLSGPVIQYRCSRLPREVRFRLSLFRPSDEGKRTEIAQETPSGNRTLHIIALILILAILCSPAMYILNMAIPRGKDTGHIGEAGLYVTTGQYDPDQEHEPLAAHDRPDGTRNNPSPE